VSAPLEEGAWLEAADGTRHPIKGSCSVGRSGANTIVLESPKVSRRHALIHLQNIGELWLIDFGSSNGTFLNKRRIHHPIRLKDGNHITIGDQLFTFRQPVTISEEYKYSLLAAGRGHSRFYASEPPNAERGLGPPSRSVDF
jgi:pSer/pThr/pTyr-binding forkhead associated (FHA) protein